MIEALRTGLLPGVRGLDRVEPEFPLGGVAAATRTVAARYGLATALDLDGGAHALVLERWNGRVG